jgi:hypothetical protein
MEKLAVLSFNVLHCSQMSFLLFQLDCHSFPWDLKLQILVPLDLPLDLVLVKWCRQGYWARHSYFHPWRGLNAELWEFQVNFSLPFTTVRSSAVTSRDSQYANLWRLQKKGWATSGFVILCKDKGESGYESIKSDLSLIFFKY